MDSIYKYKIPREKRFILRLSINDQVLTAQFQGEEAVLWALVDLNEEPINRHFEIFMTGERFKDTGYLEYIATLQYPDGIVAHLFEDKFANTRVLST